MKKYLEDRPSRKGTKRAAVKDKFIASLGRGSMGDRSWGGNGYRGNSVRVEFGRGEIISLTFTSCVKTKIRGRKREVEEKGATYALHERTHRKAPACHG